MKKLQFKLTLMLLMTSTLPLLLLAVITIFFLGRLAVNESLQRINNNLKIASGVYSGVSNQLEYAVKEQNRRIATLIEDKQFDLLRNEYKKVIARNKLDFFFVTDPSGKVLVSMANPKLEGYDYSRNVFVRLAMHGKTIVSTEALGESALDRLGILSKARIKGVEPVRGMVIMTSMPVINPNEVTVGTMTAGYLINNNNPVLVDKITADTGGLMASILLDNLRISSNIPTGGKFEIIGSTLPAKFAGKTLLGGKNFLSRIPVQKSWCLSGYTPIQDSEEKIIGMIGVAIPEKEVFKLRDRLIKLFTLTVFLSILISLSFGMKKGAAIVSSINKLHQGIEAFGKGNFYHRLEIHSQDEIEELADFFNETMEQLMLAKNEIEVSSRNIMRLENRVTKSDAQLQAVHKQLLEYERMAAMGKMATALSHELRNVFSEIQTGAYNLKAQVNKDLPQFGTYLRTIEEGLNRANEILSNVLSFSYPKKLILSDVDMNYLIGDMLNSANLKEQLKNNKVNVIKDFESGLLHIKVDGLQMREAILNLVTNAVQAMPEGGKLSISTRNERDMIKIKIADTGTGMSKEAIDNLFTPFFTTKSRGLGLGLCITKSVVQEHGGQILVESEAGKGTVFNITLPLVRGV
jgi:two-component system NtrC family sensor kinase